MRNSRGPESLADLVAELGPHARATSPAEAAEAGDLVVATIPLHAYHKLPITLLAGKTVIDTMNYYPDRDGRITELDTGNLTSSSLVQQRLADSRVVKAFNNIAFIHLLTLARPAGAPDRSALPIAGDHLPAKADITDLLDTLGYDAVDVGALADSWRFEPDTPVYTKPYSPGQPPEGLTREAAYQWFLETPGVPASTTLVETLTTNTTRTTAGGNFPNPD